LKRFNVTGLCVPDKHYMVDLSDKVEQIKELVDDSSYFVINRARQFGKTTILSALRRVLKEHYTVISVSFEELGYESFASSESFCIEFMEIVQNALQFEEVDDEYLKCWVNTGVHTFKELSRHITRMCEGENVVLMIDEVDKTSNNRVFLDFLSLLRSKFLARENGNDYTFHSVILAGVYDIKNIKLKMIQEGTHVTAKDESKVYNSPWNIAVDFTVDLSFNPTDIESMLRDYEEEYCTGMCLDSLSKEIYTYTSGYPYLVSRVCQHIDKKLNKNWTVDGVNDAVKILFKENNTLFDDLFKNLENHIGLYDLIYDVLIVGRPRSYFINDPVIKLGMMYGIVSESNGLVQISNQIFERAICNYFVVKDEHNKKSVSGVLRDDVMHNGKFNMELCLRKFSEHYFEIFSEKDIHFLEQYGRLIFLSYLKPLINGLGFFHIESQFTDLRRMDVVVDVGRQQFIVELKIWHGEEYYSKGILQLCGYLESKNMDEGYLLTFDFRKRDKIRRAEWKAVHGKRIFDVIV